MKIFAFDARQTTQWKKCWADIGAIDVCECSTSAARSTTEETINNACNSGDVLLLIHQQECMSSVEGIVSKLIGNCPSLFVMYVTEGNQDKNDNNDRPRVHYSGRIVPSTKPLGYLKNIFFRLCKALSNARTDTRQIKLAWEEWESPVLTRLIFIISPLLLEPMDEKLANFVASNIFKELRHASDELGNEVGEKALRDWLLNSEATGTGLLEWVQNYPQTLRELARRYL